jgi:hypothetical protein
MCNFDSAASGDGCFYQRGSASCEVLRKSPIRSGVFAEPDIVTGMLVARFDV